MALAQRPASLVALGEPSGPPAWKTIPSWYMIAGADKAIGADAEKAMAKRINAKKTVTVKGASHVVDHLPAEDDGGLHLEAAKTASERRRPPRHAGVERAHGRAALLGGRAVEHQHAVEVVELVLEDAGVAALGLDPQRLAGRRPGRRARPRAGARPRRCTPRLAEREAAFEQRSRRSSLAATISGLTTTRAGASSSSSGSR